MDIVSQPNFHTLGSLGLPGRYKYVSIAAESDIETCKIGSHQLSVGSVVPWAPTAFALRGPRDATTEGTGYGSETGTLSLALWEGCEHPIVGPRAPTIRDNTLSAIGAATTAATSVRALSLPFFGRRQGTFHLYTSAVTPVSFIVRGIKLRSPDGYAQLGADDVPFISEETGTFGRAPSARGDFALSLIYNFGGEGDACEDFDLAELWIYGSEGLGAGKHYCRGESYGER